MYANFRSGGRTIVFTETKESASELAGLLPGARALHGDVMQAQREVSTMRFQTASGLACTFSVILDTIIYPFFRIGWHAGVLCQYSYMTCYYAGHTIWVQVRQVFGFGCYKCGSTWVRHK